MNDIRKIVRSVLFALKGLRHAYNLDKSFRMEINYGFPIFVAFGWYLSPLLPWELIILVLAYFLILLVELMNTAFEKMLDRVHPEKHPLTAASKDIASASVFIAFLFATIVLFVLVMTRITSDAGVSIEHLFV